jgi:micrococcal nuclease
MYDYNCELIRVVDGDTVDLNVNLGFDIWVKKRVRLYGIDAPESRTRDLEEKKLGIAATLALKELLDDAINFHNGTIRLESKIYERDKFGRVLGILHLDTSTEEGTITSTVINRWMVQEGHANKTTFD